MRFPRNAKIFKGQLDAAPFAGVFFLLVLFLLLGAMIYTPGVRIQLPAAADLPGTGQPTLGVALDANGQLFFDNQIIQPAELKARLQAAAKKSAEPLVLVVRADRLRSNDCADVEAHLAATIVVTFDGTDTPTVTVNGTHTYRWNRTSGLITRA